MPYGHKITRQQKQILELGHVVKHCGTEFIWFNNQWWRVKDLDGGDHYTLDSDLSMFPKGFDHSVVPLQEVLEILKTHLTGLRYENIEPSLLQLAEKYSGFKIKPNEPNISKGSS